MSSHLRFCVLQRATCAQQLRSCRTMRWISHVTIHIEHRCALTRSPRRCKEGFPRLEEPQPEQSNKKNRNTRETRTEPRKGGGQPALEPLGTNTSDRVAGPTPRFGELSQSGSITWRERLRPQSLWEAGPGRFIPPKKTKKARASLLEGLS